MLPDQKIEKNKKALSWWCRYYESASNFLGYGVGIYDVSVYDVFPNLRAHHSETGSEFEIQDTKSVSKGPIEVFVDKHDGIIIIQDGHHRFHEAISRKANMISVRIMGTKSHETYLYNALSPGQRETLISAKP